MNTFEYKGRKFAIISEPDNDHGAPWDEYDGIGEIRTIRERGAKKPSEVIIHTSRFEHWVYDVKASIEKARRESWGLSDNALAALRAKIKPTKHRVSMEPTPREIIRESVARDMAYCRGYLNGDWGFVILGATLLDRGGNKTEFSFSIGGVQSDQSDMDNKAILEDCAHQCLAELESHVARLDEIQAAERARLTELLTGNQDAN